MIIDFHAHVAYHKFYPDRFLTGVLAGSADAVTGKALAVMKLFLQDQQCSQLLRQMDEAHIEKTVLHIVDDHDYFGKMPLTLEENYAMHAQLLRLHPDRFVVFAGYHPDRQGGLDLLRKGIETLGFRGVKLYPPYGFSVADPRMEPCYRYCQQEGLPVLIHTGFSMPGLDNRYAEPDELETVAGRYARIRFIMAHAGYKLNVGAIRRLLSRENVYADISGFQTVTGSEEGRTVLKMIFDDPYNTKILFGSDWPVTNLMKPLLHQIGALRELSGDADGDQTVRLSNLFKNNALRILNGSMP